ncbi:hypothetical protein FIBSPDRAFT_866558, partial [Athelia psychrophila]
MSLGAETAGMVGEALGAVGGAVGKAFPWLLLAPVVLAGGVMYAGGSDLPLPFPLSLVCFHPLRPRLGQGRLGGHLAM